MLGNVKTPLDSVISSPISPNCDPPAVCFAQLDVISNEPFTVYYVFGGDSSVSNALCSIACGCGATTLVSRSQTPERTGDARVDVFEEAVQNEEDGEGTGGDEKGEVVFEMAGHDAIS
mgnify:CR=1 FL=1